MIKILKNGMKKEEKTARIICPTCKCEFEATTDEMSYATIGHGIYVQTILCPQCNIKCYEWQGGADKWEWLTEG